MTDFKGFKGRGDKIDPGLVRYYAEATGLDYRVVMAIVDVEASGHGFDKQGRPKMLFEPHYFYRALKAKNNAQSLQHAVSLGIALPSAPPLSWYSKRPAYENLAYALGFDQDAALTSASWGMGQVMGINWTLVLDWHSPSDMVLAMMDDEDNHVRLMISFLNANPRIKAAMQSRNWPAIALGYNGAGYRKNRYDEKLSVAFARRCGMPLPRVIFPAPKVVAVADEIDNYPRPAANDDQTSDQVVVKTEATASAAPSSSITAPAPLIVQAVQTKLLQLGYFVVGKTDGIYGPNTKAGIERFMMDNGIAGQADINPALVAQLESAPPAKADPARAKTTVQDLRQGGSQIVKHTDRIKWLAWLQGLPALGVGAVYGASDYLGSAWSFVQQAKTAVGDVPAWVWIVGVIVISVFMWAKAKETQDERVAQERDGRSTLAPNPVALQPPASES